MALHLKIPQSLRKGEKYVTVVFPESFLRDAVFSRADARIRVAPEAPPVRCPPEILSIDSCWLG